MSRTKTTAAATATLAAISFTHEQILHRTQRSRFNFKRRLRRRNTPLFTRLETTAEHQSVRPSVRPSLRSTSPRFLELENKSDDAGSRMMGSSEGASKRRASETQIKLVFALKVAFVLKKLLSSHLKKVNQPNLPPDAGGRGRRCWPVLPPPFRRARL